MQRIPDDASRADVMRFLAQSATYGNLGLFVGSGFSRAAVSVALTWHQLLEKISTDLELDFDGVLEDGVGYPEAGSRLCEKLAETRNLSWGDATTKFKRKIADLTCWYPDPEARQTFGGFLVSMQPEWIITTNYDLVIEGLLPGHAFSLGPLDEFASPRELIPVFHMHGIRTNPTELVATQEDYVSLFRPNEYRQLRLAIAMKESTTLFLGYALNDVNVLTAIDWARHVFETTGSDFPRDFIQVVRKSEPSAKPYRDRNGIMVVESRDLPGFFEEYLPVGQEDREKARQLATQLEGIAAQIATAPQEMVDKFIDDDDFRGKLLHALSLQPGHLIVSFLAFLDSCIEKTWARAQPRGAFQAYNENVKIILDILLTFDQTSIPPALFQRAAYSLNRLAPFIGDQPGQGYQAAATWRSRGMTMPRRMLRDLSNIADRHDYVNLQCLLENT